MNLLHRWRRFWSGSYVPRNEFYATHLKACAPTVTPEEVARLERKRLDTLQHTLTRPVDWDDLPT